MNIRVKKTLFCALVVVVVAAVLAILSWYLFMRPVGGLDEHEQPLEANEDTGCGCEAKTKHNEVERGRGNHTLKSSFRVVSDEPALYSDWSCCEWLEKSSSLLVRLDEKYRRIRITGIENGAIVKIVDYDEDRQWANIPFLVALDSIEADINKREWQDFLSYLYNSGIREWRKNYRIRRHEGVLDYGPEGSQWLLHISVKNDTADGYTPLVESGGNDTPPNGYPLNLIWHLANKIEHDKYLAEYKHRTGTAMSEYQGAIQKIFFYDGGYWATIMRPDKDETRLEYFTYSLFRQDCEFEFTTILNRGDWFDIVHALRYRYPTLDYNKRYKNNVRVRKKDPSKVAIITMRGLGVDKIDLTARKPEELEKVLDAIIAKTNRVIIEEALGENCK